MGPVTVSVLMADVYPGFFRTALKALLLHCL